MTPACLRVIKIAKKAYPDGDLISPKNLGDGLAQFIYNEIDGVAGHLEDTDEALEAAAEALWTAIAEMRDVVEALENAVGKEDV